MSYALSHGNRTALDVVKVIAGLGLFLAPWYLGFSAEAHAAWSAWIIGAAMILVALAALFAFNRVEEWVNGVLGILAVISPWVLGFSTMTPATTVHVVAGLIVLALAAASLWFTSNRPFSTA